MADNPELLSLLENSLDSDEAHISIHVVRNEGAPRFELTLQDTGLGNDPANIALWLHYTLTKIVEAAPQDQTTA